MAYVPTVTLDCMGAAASYIAREWGDHGYRIGLQTVSPGGTGIFLVTHFDGSEFHVASDRYGNTYQVALVDGVWQKTDGDL